MQKVSCSDTNFNLSAKLGGGGCMNLKISVREEVYICLYMAPIDGKEALLVDKRKQQSQSLLFLVFLMLTE